ncbi:MAG TPA: c-type cytochrome [Hyphomicrobiaceae bacterium]|nr:c-type cytochrome [Hyphomicrobiaceae bacterium]
MEHLGTIRATALGLSLGVLLGSAPAFAADRGAGEQIAARECAGCHGVGSGRGVTIQGVYVPGFAEIARRPYQSRDRLKSYLLIPRHPMPGIALREEDVSHVVEYILSFRD